MIAVQSRPDTTHLPLLLQSIAQLAQPQVLHPASATELRFFARETVREYAFERDASGCVVRIRVTGGGQADLIAERVD